MERVMMTLLPFVVSRVLSLLFLSLAFCAAPAAVCAPKNVYPVEGCSKEGVLLVVSAFQQAKSPIAFDLYVICTEKAWQDFLKAHRFPASVVALTDWKAGRIFVGPHPINDEANLHRTAVHELKHLTCHCNLGENL